MSSDPGIAATRQPARPTMTLGSFLRTRREELSPASAGIHGNSRRRTPGLRRDEVARLAAISPEWYTFLEQDRDVRPSVDVIERIGAALQLTWAEREYLNVLAFPRLNQPSPGQTLPAGVRQFIDDLDYRPAYVVNDFWNLVGWNAAAGAVFPGLHPTAQPNLVTSVFLDPEWRRLYKNWEANARRMLALFRLTVASHVDDERCAAVLARLNAGSPEFVLWWREQGVIASSSGSKELIHPRVGDLSLDYCSFRTTDDSPLSLVVFRPSDESTRRRLVKLQR